MILLNPRNDILYAYLETFEFHVGIEHAQAKVVWLDFTLITAKAADNTENYHIAVLASGVCFLEFQIYSST